MKNLILYFVLVSLIPVSLASQVKINEVLYDTATGGGDRVELKNFDSTAVDVTNWWLCTLFVYDQLSTLTVESGSLTIPAGGLLVLSGRSLSNSADLGLFNEINSNADFGNPSFMEDFVQWGGAGLGRESVAAAKGIWTAGEFVATVAQDNSIEYDGDGDSAADWFEQDNPTIGEENGIISSVGDEAASIPDDFTLAQNFPNPFNPSTVINYTLPQSANLARVKLEIFNLLGQKVRTIVNAGQTAGPHSVRWDGADDTGNLLAGGLYVYRLQAGGFVETKKMIFLK